MPKLKLKKTKNHDHFDRRIYRDRTGKKYVDVNLDDSNPQICTTCNKSGEPSYPIDDYVIIEFDGQWRTYDKNNEGAQ